VTLPSGPIRSNPLWTETEEQRLMAYHTPDGDRALDEILAEIDKPTEAASLAEPTG
jgi:hypothetical protein